jgi:hypothetical protein
MLGLISFPCSLEGMLTGCRVRVSVADVTRWLGSKQQGGGGGGTMETVPCELIIVIEGDEKEDGQEWGLQREVNLNRAGGNREGLQAPFWRDIFNCVWRQC